MLSAYTQIDIDKEDGIGSKVFFLQRTSDKPEKKYPHIGVPQRNDIAKNIGRAEDGRTNCYYGSCNRKSKTIDSTRIIKRSSRKISTALHTCLFF